MLYAIYSDSATAMSSSFAFKAPGKDVRQKPLSGSLFLYPPAASGQLRVKAGLTKAGEYPKEATKNNQMCTYTRDVVVYVHILCTYKQVMPHAKKTDSVPNDRKNDYICKLKYKELE